MPDFNTWSGLLNHLEKTVEKSLDQIAETIRQVLYDYVKRDWYGRPESDFYQRTDEVLNSISVLSKTKTPKGYQVQIGFDLDKINSTQTENFFNSHMSLDGSTSFGGVSITEWVIIWMSEGQASPWPQSGANFLENINEFAKDESVHLLKEHLEKAGFADVIIS